MVDVIRPTYRRSGTPVNKGKTYPAEILTPDEVRALAVQCSKTTFYGIRRRALIVMLYRTGLRISEALALCPKDLNFEVGAIAVLHGKGNRQRTVGIDPGANPHIEKWLERRETLDLPAGAPLFCTVKGMPLAATSVNRLLRRLAQSARIAKRVHPHGFRHTHAYELMMEGVPMPIIQQQLGHASLATTDRYLAHIAPKQVIETMSNREWSP
ncbi:MAG: site-specific integrase [Actinomycetia bacterium]|nr:site-specific integrase [Actinomycetes bacterium]